ncbi:MAG: tRNA threonylcarbamoyladenosine dehydratase [Clostridiales bacterium]|mgnify:CR=1 FL=1|nr:tRNA threonylcarbamoyladenosine dehydratase [Clostridiales bacterium]
MSDQFIRTESIIGSEALKRLASSRVAVFGLGGVGGAVAEALARAGVGTLDLVDSDRISESNLNRQIIALHSKLGMLKTDAFEERIKDINPLCKVNKYELFYGEESADAIDLAAFDFIADCIDSVSSKLFLIERAKRLGVPIVSSMGAGNKLDPSAFEAADIYESSVDPLARLIRRECKKRDIESLRVVYSKEAPIKPLRDSSGHELPVGSSPFAPPAAGLLVAYEVVRGLIGN